MTTMTTAIWNGAVIASTDHYELVDGNVYFPPSCSTPSPATRTPPAVGRGKESYYTIAVDGKQNKDAAWFYPSPKPAANNQAHLSGEPRLVQLYWITSPFGKEFRLRKLPSSVRGDRHGRDHQFQEV